MYHSNNSFGRLLFRFVEIIIAINIVILDMYLFHSYIGSATSTVPAATKALATPTPTDTSLSPSTPTTIINQVTGAKEIFIPIGQGSSYGTDWTSVTGAQVQVDSTKYTGIKQVVFEATLESPNNQIVSVRLYNKTDDHAVWYSEMMMTSTTQFLTSPSIQLDTGDKLYQVQIKTQLGYSVVLDQARIHIKLQ